MRLVLPYPVSTNRYWRVNRFGTPYATKEAREYKADVRAVCNRAGIFRICRDDAVELHMWLYPKGKRVMDLDNAMKITLDAFQGAAYDNDSQVKRIVAEVCPPDEKGARLEVDVMRFGRSKDGEERY